MIFYLDYPFEEVKPFIGSEHNACRWAEDLKNAIYFFADLAPMEEDQTPEDLFKAVAEALGAKANIEEYLEYLRIKMTNGLMSAEETVHFLRLGLGK